MTSVTRISFVDITGQLFRFELDDRDGIVSLVLGPLKSGVHRLFVNHKDEGYLLYPKGIIEHITEPSERGKDRRVR